MLNYRYHLGEWEQPASARWCEREISGYMLQTCFKAQVHDDASSGCWSGFQKMTAFDTVAPVVIPQAAKLSLFCFSGEKVGGHEV